MAFPESTLNAGHSFYVLGLIYILLVAVIQAVSSTLVQYLYTVKAFESPFLLTYIGVSLFTWPLPLRFITDKVLHPCFEASVIVCNEASDLVAPAGECDRRECDMAYACYGEAESQGGKDRNASSQIIESAGATHAVAVDSSENGANFNHFVDDADDDDDEITVDSKGSPPRTPKIWTSAQHLRAALQIAPVWFIANLSYNASLSFSSISASTVLMSSCSLFAFLFAVMSHSEGYHWMKLAGVGMGLLGSGLIAFHDSQMKECHRDCQYALVGDLLAFISAIAFGAYAVQIKKLCPKDEELYSMQRILGYIGLINMVVLSPIALWKLFKRVEMTYVIFQLIIIRGVADYVISEYLYFKAVIYTNATVATLGLGLTIPFAFVADMVLGYPEVLSVWSIVGALSVGVGFLFVNSASVDENYNKLALETAKEYEVRRQQQMLYCHQLPCGCLMWLDNEELNAETSAKVVEPTLYDKASEKDAAIYV